ncbi:hypothetical protein [Herminiimonas sp.]|uniref:hypothetical protein n=1 Tax=Herminiimonas sp. TaxID=1926289 RepID=UPI002719550C|nr:hypothetical protein [Herminiimonas sp.]MDO8306118.1 hypothetical protein [Herminiimonas sp.]
MNPSKTLTSILAASLLIAGLAACQKKEEVAIDKGPAETAGQKVDQATSTAVQKMDEAAAKVAQDAEKAKADISQGTANMTDAAGKKVEEAGVKMQEAAKDSK